MRDVGAYCPSLGKCMGFDLFLWFSRSRGSSVQWLCHGLDDMGFESPQKKGGGGFLFSEKVKPALGPT